MSNRYGTTPTGPGEYRDGAAALARPKEAATLIVVRAGDQPTILMGKRAATHRYMPNKFVFPGGRLDAIDQRLQIRGELSDPVMSRLRKATRKDVTDRKLRGLALAAIRETFEETGLVVGRPSSQSVKTAHPVWQQYLSHGVEPPLAQMDFIARAITPPTGPGVSIRASFSSTTNLFTTILSRLPMRVASLTSCTGSHS